MALWRVTREFMLGTQRFAAGGILDDVAEDVPMFMDEGMPLEAVATGTARPMFVDLGGVNGRVGVPDQGHRLLTAYRTIAALINALPRTVNEPLNITIGGIAPVAYSFAGHLLLQGATVTWTLDGTVQAVAPLSGVISAAISDRDYTTVAAVSVRDAVYIDAAGVAQRAIADGVDLATVDVVGFVVSKSNPTTCTVRGDGELGGYAGLTPGATQWLSTTVAGGRTETKPEVPPLAAGVVAKPLGQARNATTIELDMEQGFTVQA